MGFNSIRVKIGWSGEKLLNDHIANKSLHQELQLGICIETQDLTIS